MVETDDILDVLRARYEDGPPWGPHREACTALRGALVKSWFGFLLASTEVMTESCKTMERKLREFDEFLRDLNTPFIGGDTIGVLDI